MRLSSILPWTTTPAAPAKRKDEPRTNPSASADRGVSGGQIQAAGRTDPDPPRDEPPSEGLDIKV